MYFLLNFGRIRISIEAFLYFRTFLKNLKRLKIKNSKKVKREEVDRRVKEDSPKFSEKFSDQPEAVDICERVSFKLNIFNINLKNIFSFLFLVIVEDPSWTPRGAPGLLQQFSRSSVSSIFPFYSLQKTQSRPS